MSRTHQAARAARLGRPAFDILPPRTASLGRFQEATQTTLIDVPRHCRPAQHDPDMYAVQAIGDCMAPIAPHGSMLIASPATPLRAGGLVVVWFKQLSPMVKRLVKVPLLPHGASVADEVEEMIEFEMLFPARRFWRASGSIDSIHAVTGVMAPGEFNARSPLAGAA